jgi:hypothetical protein
MAAASQRFAETGQSGAEMLLRSREAAAAAQCMICIEDLVAAGGVTVLPGCSHAFHSGCIREWLNTAPTPTCPSCRRDMTKQRAYMKALTVIRSSQERRRSEEEDMRRIEYRLLRYCRRRTD